MTRILIVDGHSAVFASRDLLEAHESNPRLARQMLVDQMNAYQGATGESVVIVFDGQGPDASHEGGNEGEALIIYSARGASADAVIERVAARQAAKYRVTVASNDRMILDAAMASGADAISIRSLDEQVRRSLADFRGKWGLG